MAGGEAEFPRDGGLAQCHTNQRRMGRRQGQTRCCGDVVNLPYNGSAPAVVDTIAGNTPWQFRTLVQKEVVHWNSVVATAKIKVE